MKPRPRSRRLSRAGGSGATILKLAVPLLLAVLIVLAGPSNLITAISLPRGTSFDVATDPSSVVGLNTTHVGAGTNRELTTITNQFDQSITVTLSLTGDSKERSTLYVNGIDYGDSVTFSSIASGENVSVNASVRCKDALVGKGLTYDIDFSGDGINGTIQDRSVAIEQYCLTWYTAADWDAFSLEHGVVHESFGDHDAADIELGYNTTDANLTAYWPLDEDSGSTAVDVTDNGHNGTITGASLGQTGILGSTAYDFDGTDDVVNVSSSSELRGGSTATISAAAWFKAEAASSGQPGIVGKQLDASNGDWGLVYTATCPDWNGSCGNASLTTPTLNNFTESTIEGGSSTYTYQHGHSNGSNQITLVFVLWNGKKTQEVSSVSYGGNSLNESTDAAFSAGTNEYVNAEIWYIRDAAMPAAGSHTVQVNHPQKTQGGQSWLSYAYTFDGIDQTSPFDNAKNSSQNALSISTNVSASSDTDALVSAIVEDSGILVTWDYNETEKSDTQPGGFGTSTAWKLTSNGPGNVTTGASNGGGPTLQSLVTVTLEPASTGSGGSGPYVGYYSEDGGNDYGLLYGKGIENGNWYHAAFVLDQANNNLYLYVDGRQVNKDESLPQVSASTSADVEIGGTTYSSDYFNGTIDEVRVYNRTLSDREVAILANGSDPYNTSAEWNGTHVTGWESTHANLSVGSLQLSDVVADGSGGTINVYVESDTDGDGSTEETSAGITVNSSTGPYDVTGLSTDSDRFRLRVELSTAQNTTSPCFSGATLSPGDGLNVGTRSGCGTTNATANQQPTANFTYTETSDNWYDDSWTYRKNVTIDHRKVASDLSDYPVLINISDADLAADAQNDGDDILFTTQNGSIQLDHEIESFDGSTGDLVAWVKVPQVSATAPNTTIHMYYNNSGAANQENVSSVWTSEVRGVWHLAESSGSTAKDSSGYDNNGSVTGATLGADGQIDGAYDLDGSNDYVNISDDPSLDVSGPFTLSAWINATAASGQLGIITKGKYNGTHVNTAWNFKINTGNLELVVTPDGENITAVDSADAAMKSNVTTHVAARYNGSTIALFINGTHTNKTAYSDGVYNSSKSVLIGGLHGDSIIINDFEGTMDEGRIINRSRSDAWIETTYNNTFDPAGFHTIGTEENSSSGESGGTSSNVSFDASASSDSDGTIETYKWDFDSDGVYEETTTSATTTREMDAGDTDVTLQVIDDDSATDTRTKTVTVITENPTARFTYSETWSKRKTLTIDHTKVASNLSDYPVLINLSDTDLADKAQADGDDILFTNASGVQLDHEIESYDGSTGHLVAWIRVPNVSASSDTTLYMYYNNSEASNQENVSGVWTSEYVLVQHLEESSGSTVTDSSPKDNDGTNNGSTQGVTGKVGNAYDFETSNHESVTVSTSASLNVSYVHYSAWVKAESSVDNAGVIAKGGDSNRQYWIWHYNDTIHYEVDETSYKTDYPKLSTNTWYKLDIVYNGSTTRAYLNGSLLATHTQSTGTVLTHNEGLYIGQLPGWEFWDGVIDEVRVRNGSAGNVTSNAWIETTYNNTNDPSSFYSVGSETNTVAASFNASNSSDPDGTVSTYAWDWDDDRNYETTVGGPRIVHDFGSSGNYTVTLQVTDNESATDTTSKTVTIGNLQPTAEFTSTSWSGRKALTIDHTRVESDLSAFPVLVNLTDTDLKNEAQADGDDILFTDADGETKLAHEIEDYDGSNGHLTAWVRVPNVSASSDTTIYLYYNNSEAANQENVSGVWDSEYVLVQHLEETSGNTVTDSSPNSNDGTNNGSTQGVTGKVGDAYDFESSNDESVNVSTSASLNVSYVHYSAWVKAESFVDNAGIIAKGGDANRQYWIWHFNNTIHYEVDETSYKTDYPKLSADTWYKLDIVYNGSTTRAYLNGSLQATHTQSTGTVLTHNEKLYIGQLPGYEHWDGIIDEVRVRDGSAGDVSSDAWIGTTYNNTNDPSSFVAVGSEENGTLVRFNASNSSDPDGSIATYEWDFTDDGTYDESSSDPTTFNRYASTGSYDVTLRVTDDGGKTHENTSTITLGAAPS